MKITVHIDFTLGLLSVLHNVSVPIVWDRKTKGGSHRIVKYKNYSVAPFDQLDSDKSFPYSLPASGLTPQISRPDRFF